jgi:hypothetical protein
VVGLHVEGIRAYRMGVCNREGDGGKSE